VENSDYDLRVNSIMSWHCLCYVPLTHPSGLNYEMRRVVIIEYSIQIHKNKEIKAKVNYNFCLDFTEFI